MDLARLEEPCKHGADAICRERVAFLLCSVKYAIHQHCTVLLQLLVDLWSALQFPQRRDSSGHGRRIAGECPCLIDGPKWRNQVHEFCEAAISAYGKTSADNLAQGGEIRLDLVELLRAAKAKTKA